MAILTLIAASEQSDHALCEAVHVKYTDQEAKYDRKWANLDGQRRELLSRALSEVKTKIYEESETSLDDTQALDAIVSCFRTMKKEGEEEETRHAYLSPSRKQLVLGTLLDRAGGADRE